MMVRFLSLTAILFLSGSFSSEQESSLRVDKVQVHLVNSSQVAIRFLLNQPEKLHKINLSMRQEYREVRFAGVKKNLLVSIQQAEPWQIKQKEIKGMLPIAEDSFMADSVELQFLIRDTAGAYLHYTTKLLLKSE